MSCFGMRSGSKASGTRNNTEEEELSSDEKVVKPRAEPVPDPTVGMVGLKSIGGLPCTCLHAWVLIDSWTRA